MRRFLERFRQAGVDVEVPEVATALDYMWWCRAEGTDRIFQRDATADGTFMGKRNSFGFVTSDEPTDRGKKVIAKRRAVGKIAKASRKAQQRRAAVARRKRQWRRRVGR